MKILFDSRLGLDGNTGISYVSKNILESIISIYGKQNVYLYTNTLVVDSDIPPQQQIVTKYSPFSIALFSKYPKGFNLIFCPHTSPQFTNKNQKMIFIIHDICFLYPFFWRKYSLIDQFKKRLLKYKIRQVSKIAFKIIAPSTVVSYHLKNKLNITSTVIDNPITIPVIDATEKITIQNYILYVGNLRNHKNITLLINVVKNKKNLKFVFIGIKEKEFISKFGVFENIIFKTNLSYSLYLSYILNADLVINTSLCEGFCIPIYESLILKKKIICLNIPIFKHLGDYLYMSKNSVSDFCELIETALSDTETKSKSFEYIPNISYTNYINLIKNELTN